MLNNELMIKYVQDIDNILKKIKYEIIIIENEKKQLNHQKLEKIDNVLKTIYTKIRKNPDLYKRHFSNIKVPIELINQSCKKYKLPSSEFKKYCYSAGIATTEKTTVRINNKSKTAFILRL